MKNGIDNFIELLVKGDFFLIFLIVMMIVVTCIIAYLIKLQMSDKYSYEEDDEEGTITIYGNPKSYAAIQKHLEECGFEDVGGDFTYIPNDLKEVTPEQRETLDKMIERLEEFDDVQTVYTNMQPEEGEEE